MRTFSIFITICAAFALTIASGCSEDGGSPSGPSHLSGQGFGGRQTDCGENGYLLSQSAALAQWEQAIEMWKAVDLDAPPEFVDGGSASDYAAALSPVLAQWETVLDTLEGSTDLVNTPLIYTGDALPAIYLASVDPVLAQWKAALEGLRGESFLDAPPVFPVDDTAPNIVCTPDTTISCIVDSTIVVYEVDAWDNCDPEPVVRCEPPSGNYFQLGDTDVTCTITDFSGNAAQCTFTVTVTAPEPPTITCPGDTVLQCAGEDGAVLDYDVIATSDCDPELTVTCEPPAGSVFPFGETTVTCQTTDIFGNTADCSFTVIVEDTTPPMIQHASATPGELWPPNHKMVDVELNVDMFDTCDPSPSCWIYDITSNEDINGKGDGNTEPDWKVMGNTGVQLRAERAGPNSGRVYTVHFRCMDAAGNLSEGSVDVTVPHDQGH